MPYRECRLTHTLQASLSSETNTALLCTLQPDKKLLSEALATIRFASRASKMPISREVRDRAPDPFLKVSELNKEIETLKRELSVQSLLTRGKSTMGRSRNSWNQGRVPQIFAELCAFWSQEIEPLWLLCWILRFWHFGAIATIRAFQSERCQSFTSSNLPSCHWRLFRVYWVPSGVLLIFNFRNRAAERESDCRSSASSRR